MIKIKNYIFHENDIRSIEKYNGYLRLDLKFRTYYLDIDATFKDIEWNYGENTNNKIKEENKELVETNIELANKNKELEEELEVNKKEWKDILDSRDKLSSIISNAIKYIEDNACYSADIKQCCDDLLYSNCDKLLKILKGE